MPLQATHPLTDPSGSYRDELLAVLGIQEGFRRLPYIDVPPPGPAIATIGYGFNIETVSAYMALTLNQLGILGNKTAGETQQILGQFIVAATRTNVEANLQAGLNALAQQHGVPEFKIDQTQATTIYTQILSGASIAVIGGSPLVIQGKEGRLDSNLGNSLAHDTKEYVALMSLFYNAESLVRAGSNLATAVINGNRVEAWYEIRYQSNSGAIPGIASRRYAESGLFGLYNGFNGQFPASELEARQVIGFLRQPNIEEKIITDDVRNKLNPSGVTPGSVIDHYLQPAESLLKALFYSSAAHVFGLNADSYG